MLTPQLMESLSGTDVLILNVPYPGNKARSGNLDTESAIKIISHVRPSMAILTHFSWEMLKADPLQEAREVQKVQNYLIFKGIKDQLSECQNMKVFRLKE